MPPACRCGARRRAGRGAVLRWANLPIGTSLVCGEEAAVGPCASAIGASAFLNRDFVELEAEAPRIGAAEAFGRRERQVGLDGDLA